jgi:hypothetical protein
MRTTDEDNICWLYHAVERDTAAQAEQQLMQAARERRRWNRYAIRRGLPPGAGEALRRDLYHIPPNVVSTLSECLAGAMSITFLGYSLAPLWRWIA